MPGLVRKLLICAAAEGLLLHPVLSDKSAGGAPGTGLKIEYGTQRIATIPASDETERDRRRDGALETFGVIGMLDLVSASYLISITRREQVAQVRGYPIYTIRDVTLIPLSSRGEAERAILAAAQKLSASKRQSAVVDPAAMDILTDESDVGEENDAIEVGGRASVDEQTTGAKAVEVPKAALQNSATNIKSAVQEKGGKYGSFAQRWFSRGAVKGPTAAASGVSETKAEQDTVQSEALTDEQARQVAKDLPSDDSDADAARRSFEDTKAASEGTSDVKKPAVTPKRAIHTLSPRILKSARFYFSTSGFYFSYDYDLSRSWGQQTQDTSAPLWKRYESLFFWNRHLLKPFTEPGHDAFALPVIQGFVGQRAFSISGKDDLEPHPASEGTEMQDLRTDKSGPAADSSDFLLTLISRRSVKRTGLRYLRRGVDDDGFVANNVETEQILAPAAEGTSGRTFSLLQLRGSIPLFFSQSPYSFKPVPVMFGSEATNQAAFARHFTRVKERYGRVQCVSLVDKHGTEISIGEAYEKQANVLNEKGGVSGEKMGFEWFDFHGVCKGMNFKNVSILLDTLQASLESFSWLITQDGKAVQQQTGILRTNCMDCLGRTNVVQSAVAGWALSKQLAELGKEIDLQNDPKTQWFNVLWADNGDAISKQYAGTSALKGDFTRTRKRNWKGALSDFSLTLNRYYNNIFGDYFLQTCIDYYLGNAGPAIFDEFETDMMAQDYGVNMQQVRQNAIDTCVKIVVEDPSERLHAGWTLSCPHEANTLRSLPFEECVLLLTDVALYFCRFDWTTEKVGSFERVDLRDVVELWRGAYVTSALGPTHLDESKNVGFVVRFKAERAAMIRSNTRSLQNEEASTAEQAEDEAETGETAAASAVESDKTTQKENEKTRLLAFKALPPRSTAVAVREEDSMKSGELQTTEEVTEKIGQAVAGVLARDGAVDKDAVLKIQERPIITAAEARKNTGYVESLGYSLKKLVWS